jgi:hypothetical protein
MIRTTLLSLALLAATACSTPSAPAGSDAGLAAAHTAKLDFAASAATTRATGIVHWTGDDTPDGIWLSGTLADGTTQLHIASDGKPTANVIRLRATLHRANGTIAEGVLATHAGHIVIDTLPVDTAPVVALLKSDFSALPQVLDEASCESARNNYFWLLLLAEGACALGPETGPGTIACLAAVGAAENAYNDEVRQCDACPCSNGDVCSDGVCQRPPCTDDSQCWAAYGPDYVCSGGGCVSSGICQSTGCQGQCGTVTDNCYQQIDCGACCDAACQCAQTGGVWDGTSCQPACDQACQCEEQGGNWDGVSCQPAGQCGGNPAVCYASCEAAGMECDLVACDCY